MTDSTSLPDSPTPRIDPRNFRVLEYTLTWPGRHEPVVKHYCAVVEDSEDEQQFLDIIYDDIIYTNFFVGGIGKILSRTEKPLADPKQVRNTFLCFDARSSTKAEWRKMALLFRMKQYAREANMRD